jgi:hypothetical protein
MGMVKGPQILEIVDYKLEAKLLAYAEARRNESDYKKQAEDMFKEVFDERLNLSLKESAIQLGEELGEKVFRIGAVEVRLSPHRSLSRDMLIAAGVELEILGSCYSETTSVSVKER